MASTITYTDLTGLVYPAEGQIKGNNYVQVWFDDKETPEAISSYDIINNAIVFPDVPSATEKLTIVSSLDIDELTTSPTDSSIVAGAVDNLNIVATSIDNVNVVGSNINKVTTVSENIDRVTTVADIGAEGLQGIVNNINNIEDVAAIYNQVTTVASISNAVSTVSANEAAVVAVGSNIDDVNIVASNNEDIDTLAFISSDIETLADIEDGTVATNAISTVSNIYTDVIAVADNNEDVTIVANSITSGDINTVVDNIADINNFAEKYKISATEPTGALEGDLWYDTVNNVVKYYDGSSWISVSPNLTGIDDYLGGLITEELV